MAREDIIKTAAADHRDCVCCSFYDPIADAQEESFIEGAEWADEHPNPNTIKQIFKFALEKTNFLIADNLDSIDWDKLVKQAMEE